LDEPLGEYWRGIIGGADLPSSSFGGTYVPSELASEVSTDLEDFGVQAAGPSLSAMELKTERRIEAPFEAGAKHLRALCQVKPSDKTRLNREHGDGAALCERILSRISAISPVKSWCKLAKLATNKPDGYPQVSYAGHNKFALLHEVVLWSSGRSRDPPAIGEEEMEISHLCNTPRCMNPSHLAVESKEANGSRKGCVPWVPCDVFCVCQGNGVIRVCPHDPPCVLHHDSYASNEDLMANGTCRDVSQAMKELLDKRKADSRLEFQPVR